MEHYWCLRWLFAGNITETSARVIRENLVRFESIPVVARVTDVPSLPADTPVRIAIVRVDLLGAALECPLHAGQGGLDSAMTSAYNSAESPFLPDCRAARRATPPNPVEAPPAPSNVPAVLARPKPVAAVPANAPRRKAPPRAQAVDRRAGRSGPGPHRLAKARLAGPRALRPPARCRPPSFHARR
jgi:hypothetical protein